MKQSFRPIRLEDTASTQSGHGSPLAIDATQGTWSSTSFSSSDTLLQARQDESDPPKCHGIPLCQSVQGRPIWDEDCFAPPIDFEMPLVSTATAELGPEGSVSSEDTDLDMDVRVPDVIVVPV